ncbi:PAAR domain-containing protein [Massilia sp. 9096]|uniref:PAAR domain-containing protein n=1 Tax=Massilia sp. 9096 TaxID=1500894 RepID=UPI001EFC026B|nr:PAAR domain-containing protein [Massilia sp. 9096]
MKRYTITLGASTTVGGTVLSASSSGSVNGVTIALEGDSVSCPACKSSGKILCVEPRIPETWNGKKVALENDLCMCGCSSPPRLVPSQSIRYQNLSDNSMASTVAHKQSAAISAFTGEPLFDDRFSLLDDDTGEPLRHTEYAIRRANGKVEFGVTDEKGHTHLLAAAARAESIEIYL